jgi:hypothetical protein
MRDKKKDPISYLSFSSITLAIGHSAFLFPNPGSYELRLRPSALPYFIGNIAKYDLPRTLSERDICVKPNPVNGTNVLYRTFFFSDSHGL